MSVNPVIVLATIPIAQQAIGAYFFLEGLCETVANLAKMIFHKIQYSFENGKPKKKQNYNKIKRLDSDLFYEKYKIKDGIKKILSGLLTMTPIVGTIYAAKLWYVQTQPNYPST